MPKSIINLVSGEHKSTAMRTFAVCVVPVTVLVVLVRALGVGPIDDTYIFLRYARNLAEGIGPVFNAGEYVEGFSSPLWTGLLGLFALSFDLEQTCVMAGIVCACASIVLVVWGASSSTHCAMGRSAPLNGRLAMVVTIALSLATCPVLFFAAGSGMDSAIFATCVIAVLLSALCDPLGGAISYRTCMLLILATFTRSEGLLLAAFVAGHSLVWGKQIRALWLLGVAVGVAHLGRYAYYEAWVPNTAYAKIAFPLSDRLARGVRYLLGAWPVTIPLLAVALLPWHFRRGINRALAHRLTLLGGWIGVYLAYVVYVGGDNIPALRFLLPVIPACCLLMMDVWTICAARWSFANRHVAICGLAALGLCANLATYQRVSGGYFINMGLAQSWSNVGRWIDQETPGDTVIATPVIGAIGYFGRRTTIDMLGLTDRTIARDGNVYAKGAHGHARYHTDYLLQRRPDLVIYMSSGRFTAPVYTSPDRIHKGTGYALYDFATDPRTQATYHFQTSRLPDGTLVEMLARGDGATAQAVAGRSLTLQH